MNIQLLILEKCYLKEITEFTMLIKRTVSSALVLISFFVTTTVFSVSVNADSTGEKLFMQNCMVCHADDGSGAMPGVSDLTETREWLAVSNSQLLVRLKAGIQKKGASVSMPPKGGNPELSDSDLKIIIRFMRKEF